MNCALLSEAFAPEAAVVVLGAIELVVGSIARGEIETSFSLLTFGVATGRPRPFAQVLSCCASDELRKPALVSQVSKPIRQLLAGKRPTSQSSLVGAS